MIRVLDSPPQLDFINNTDAKESLIFSSTSNKTLNVTTRRKKKRKWGVRTARNQSRKKKPNRFSQFYF